MNFFKRIWGSIRGFVQNRYDAATQWWGDRRWILSGLQDQRFDVSEATSLEITRKHVYLVQNTPLLQRIRNLKIQFAVGVDGLKPIPNAVDPDKNPADVERWNNLRRISFDEWAKRPELGSNLTFEESTIQWEGSLFDTGNVIIHKTRDQYNRPKIQTIDRLRLQTPPGYEDREGKDICAGVELEKIWIEVSEIQKDGTVTKSKKEITTGKPAFYFIRDEFELNKFQRIPANEIIHKFRADRPGQIVGIPAGTSSINTVIDLGDLHILEMRAAKEAGRIAVVHTNTTGELSSYATRRVPFNVGSTVPPNGAQVNQPAPGFYQVDTGQGAIAIKHGDSIKDFQIERPNICQMEYWTLKLSEICQGYNVPLLMVAPYSVQGTVARMDIDICTNAFRSDFEIIESIVREVYEWQTEWAVKFDPRLKGAPTYYKECTIRPPRAPNVDIGYTADALAKDLEMCVKTFPDACAERNEDWRKNLREAFAVEQYKQDLAKEFTSVDPSKIANWNFVSGKTAKPEEKAEETSE